jgi:hypothetical protein
LALTTPLAVITVSSNSQVVRCFINRMAGILRYDGGITEDFLFLAASFGFWEGSNRR